MKFGEIIHAWYKKNLRTLPWRQISDPYRVWISEVILQQTRVDQGLDYYHRFTRAFPDLESLAGASEDEVLKQWQGLGYYSRARNLHQAARDLVKEQAASLPGNYEGLLKMKGVGPYTAAAIASICYGERRAAVDGNVIRVLARLYGVDEAVNSSAGARIISKLADHLMEESTGTWQGKPGPGNSPGEQGAGDSLGDEGAGIHPGEHNQAMMEFGALQCVPRSPDCGACPLATHCMALAAASVDRLPRKKPARKPRDHWLYFYVLHDGDHLLIKRNSDKGIWQSLYTFPVMESGKEIAEEELYGQLLKGMLHDLDADPPAAKEPLKAEDPQPSYRHLKTGPVSHTFRHALSHRNLHARFIEVEVRPLPVSLKADYLSIPRSELDHYPVPRLMERYMKVAKF